MEMSEMKNQFAVRTDVTHSTSTNSIRRMNQRESDPDEQLKPIQITFQDRDLILDLYSVDPEMERRFKLAAVEGKGIVVQLNAYDLDELLGEIAAVANHEENAKHHKKLDALFDRVSDKLERHFPK
jgi:hypothetical protein